MLALNRKIHRAHVRVREGNFTFPNVLITAHQGFLTREALDHIATTTLGNVQAFERGGPLLNEVRASDVLQPIERAETLARINRPHR